MKNIDKLSAYLSLESSDILLGTLVLQGKDIYFKLSDEYLNEVRPFKNNSLDLSPFKIKHTSEIQQAKQFPFDGLFGLFSDSLPDAWGTLLLDRHLLAQRIYEPLNPLTRLAYVGRSGMGAIRYEPILEQREKDDFLIDLSRFQKESEKIIDGGHSKIVDEFYRLSGFSGGARPKINVGIHAKTGKIIPFSNQLPKNFQHWLIKFQSRYDVGEIAKVEYAYYLLATRSGITMAPSKLLSGRNNEVFFATQRFDRIYNNRLHLHSLAGLLHDNFTSSSLDYGHLMNVAFHLSRDRRVYTSILRVLTFNVLYGNQDDHSKNFSFIMDQNRNWQLAPFYDLTYSPSPYNYHSLSIDNKYQHINLKDVEKLGQHFGVSNIKEIISEVVDVSMTWRKTARELGIRPATIKKIEKTIEKNRGILP